MLNQVDFHDAYPKSTLTVHNQTQVYIKILSPKLKIYIYLHIYPPITKERSMRFTSSLRSCQPCLPHQDGGTPLSAFPNELADLPACSPHCTFNAERQAGKL